MNLSALCREGIVLVGDEISFKTKEYTFRALIGLGGNISNTTAWKEDVQISNKGLFTGVYNSLTAWSNACVAQMTMKHQTRYASWQRVWHTRKACSLHALRTSLKVMHPKKKVSQTLMLAEITRLHGVIRRHSRSTSFQKKKTSDLKKIDRILRKHMRGTDLSSVLKHLRTKSLQSSQVSRHLLTGSTFQSAAKQCKNVPKRCGSMSGITDL